MKIYKAMLTNNEIKVINSLSRKKDRQSQGLFIVEGNKNVEEAIKSAFTIQKIYGTDDLFSSQNSFELITEKQLERISQFKSASEALALVEIPKDRNVDLNVPSIILEDINDPGNLGTIIRTADWFGITQIICSSHSVDCFNPKVVSATKGSLFRVNVIYTDPVEFIQKSDLPAVATSLNGENLDRNIDLKDHHIVFGNESHGISQKLEQCCDLSIKIPSFNSEAESLNLAISVGVICGFIHL